MGHGRALGLLALVVTTAACQLGTGMPAALRADTTGTLATATVPMPPIASVVLSPNIADRKTPTGLGGYLRERGVTRGVVVGLATDFCVNWTAQDAARAGLETLVVEEACRAIDLDGSLAKAWSDMAALGVKRARAADFT